MIMDSTGNIKFVAERRGDLYYLQEGNEEADIVEDKTNSEFLMWHCRMGHLNANDLVRVINQNTTTSERQSEETLEIVHTDIVGPFKTQSVNGARYFITFIDDRSRWCEVYFLKQKSGALEAFKMYQTQAERVTGKKIKYLQSDNGKEYCNAEMDNFLRNQGFGNNNEIEAQAEIPEDLEDNEENEKSSGVQSSIHETQEESQEKKLKKKNEDLEDQN
ncbi:Retrovirus-related Pol polyprotein from transposon TNT 1-94 [Eumeta japonica]|uniref:Retrovirus-related Pol polyprotein from transposon TNT 1-94 n=1 Tax=Eumeta variegata TaxID=151549 RepID=A0A4C1ZVX4_EUMVA|nr:Retrovirus-related Pol polyprotein from transposon TNT 1-94 [Eumeta japonica]